MSPDKSHRLNVAVLGFTLLPEKRRILLCELLEGRFTAHPELLREFQLLERSRLQKVLNV